MSIIRVVYLVSRLSIFSFESLESLDSGVLSFDPFSNSFLALTIDRANFGIAPAPKIRNITAHIIITSVVPGMVFTYTV